MVLGKLKNCNELIFDENIYIIKKEQENTKLKPNQIKLWASIVGDKKIIKAWKFKLSIKAKDAIKLGAKGKEIGDYIRSKEKDLFMDYS